MDAQKKFDFIFVFGRSETSQPELWDPILVELSKSFLPQPDIISCLGKPDYPISGILDDKVLQAVRNEKVVILTRQDDTLNITFQPVNRLNLVISVHEDFIESTLPDTIVSLFKKIIHIRTPLTARCCFYSLSRAILDKHYASNPRTPQVPGLDWLQYFGSDQLNKQGGNSVMENPYIHAEKIDSGLLVQVGESPFDAYTSDGEALLVKATNAMPPVTQQKG